MDFFIIGFRSLQRHDDGRASACTLACGMLLMYSLPIAQKTRLFEATTILPVAIGASYGMSLFFEVLTRWRNRSGSLMRDTVLVSAITLVVVGIFAGPAVASWKRFLVRYHSDATRVSSPFCQTEISRRCGGCRFIQKMKASFFHQWLTEMLFHTFLIEEYLSGIGF